MNDSMKHKLENLILKYNELYKKLSAENITNDLNIFKKISKEHSERQRDQRAIRESSWDSSKLSWSAGIATGAIVRKHDVQG